MTRKSAVVLLLVCVVAGHASEAVSQVVAPDPREDGWQSEALSDAAGRQLSRLGRLISGQKAPGSEALAAANLLADDFHCAPLLPAGRQSVFQSKSLTVWHGTTEQPSPANVAMLRSAIGALREPFRGDDLRILFKIRRVDVVSQNQFQTKLIFTLSGPASRGWIEQNANWTVDWTRTSPSQPPLIKTITVDSFEQSYAHNKKGGRLFSDLTSTLFGDLASFREQLAFGQTYWQRRIESFHGILIPAQNGLTLGDVNGDGWDDVYVCQPGGLPNRLYLHRPDGTLRDISAASGTDILDNSHAALLIDLDNDGDQDLVLSTWSGLLVFKNNGQARFSLVSSLPQVDDAYSLAAADYDNDGDLDIYACRYFPRSADVHALPVPIPYFDATNGGPNTLLRNNGRGQLTDATELAGLNEQNSRFSYAVIWIDFDADGDQDLYVANDFGRNNLYRNDIDENGLSHFHDVSIAAGMRDGAFGMSASGGDFDRDGDEDIYVGNMFSSAGNRITRQSQFRPDESSEQRGQFQHLARGNTLFRNDFGRNGVGRRFADVSVESGVTIGRWSWGSLFADINNDGWQDLLVANGYVTGDDPQNDL